MERLEKVVIIGSGPAGLTAALYGARARLEPLVFAGTSPGGQLMTTTDVENYPGFPEGILGPDLMMKMREQAERFGARIVDDDVVAVHLQNHPFTVRTGRGEEVRTLSLIVATGASPRRLGLESESKFFGRGVSTCATCDGWFFREKVVCVIGGGDSAMEESLYLTHHARKVYVIHRRDQLRASKIMQERAFANPKIEFIWNSVVTEVLGDGAVSGVRLRNVKSGDETVLPVDGVFLAIGHEPNTGLFKGQLELDERGYVKVDPFQRTSVAGVFAAGDCHDHTFRQAVTAAGFGCAAAIMCERWLGDLAYHGYEALAASHPFPKDK
ncbi:MAG: thioredoxin-disulfide reductase [Armatimonadetes bacterium]|nr:thioredoxin-disulfide reductase [Armatimonadota bacterium]MDW8122562.1 thioredoxin-disulfide reductase [Armatimonadota bacterium]